MTFAAVLYVNHPKLNGEDTILLAGFTNNTGEAVFDGTLDRGLAIELEQSPFLSLIPEQRVRHILGLMGQPADAHMSLDGLRDLCRRAGGAAVLQGKISRLAANMSSPCRQRPAATAGQFTRVKRKPIGRKRSWPP